MTMDESLRIVIRFGMQDLKMVNLVRTPFISTRCFGLMEVTCRLTAVFRPCIIVSTRAAEGPHWLV